MAGGGFHTSAFMIAWPTGEFGGMGLEGAVRLGYRRELDAIADAHAREARYRELVEQHSDKDQAMSMASLLEIAAQFSPRNRISNATLHAKRISRSPPWTTRP